MSAKFDDNALRPTSLNDYIGQENIVKMLRVYIAAAKGRQEPLDHTLFSGPPGLGKTTLAQAIANEMGTKAITATAPAIKKPAEMGGILEKIQENDILFIDEIHGLPLPIEEMLYSAMEDFKVSVVEGRGRDAQIEEICLPKFTLVGATTRLGAMTAPLRRRFGISMHLDFYTIPELMKITERTASKLDLVMDEASYMEMANRAKGTPWLINQYMKRLRDYAQVLTNGYVNQAVILECFNAIGVDHMGLTKLDADILMAIWNNGNKPVGIANLAEMLHEEANVIRRVYEPYLMKLNFLHRGKQGRQITNAAVAYLKSIGRVS